MLHERRYQAPLTQIPFHMTVRLLSQFARHLMEIVDGIFCATRRIQGVIQMLWYRGVEIIKFPSGYLSKNVNNFDVQLLGSLPVRPPRAIHSCGVVFELVHARNDSIVAS